MKKLFFILLLGLGLVTLSACGPKDNIVKEPKVNKEVALVDGSYSISTGTSKVAWQASKVSGASHSGTVAIKSGSLTVSGGNLSGGTLTLNTKGITNDQNIDALVKHLNGKDFFDTTNYPEANLTIISATKNAVGNYYHAIGNLTMKGKTAPVAFDISLKQDGTKITALSDLKIDRTLWDIKYGSGKFFQNLGDNMISDDIILSVSLDAIK
jgi:polyisoprenoid-binding protein YceI